MVLKQGQESLRRLFPQNVPENLWLVAFRTRQLHIHCRITSYSFGSKTCLLFEKIKINYFIKLILSYSLSSLTSIFNLKFDHPILGQILDLYTNLSKDGKDIVLIWVPGLVGISGNSTADSATLRTTVALARDVWAELIPFSDLKSRANKYIL